MTAADKTKYRIETIAPGVTMIDDYSDSTSYLLEGTEKALLIDTGWGEGDYPSMIRHMTDKPIELAITHVHGDHLLHAAAFSPVYMHQRDIDILPVMNARFELLKGRELDAANITPITHGSTIDLGGGESVEVIEIAGHTPGSVAFLWRNRKLIFTGDAIGSGVGVWMQVPASLPVSQYKESLRAFLAKLEPIDGLVFWGGHVGQAGDPASAEYNPPSLQMIRDMIALCDLIIAGDAEREPFTLRVTDEPACTARHGRAAMVYLPTRL